MIHAYDKVYLEKARTTLGRMLDFAVYDLEYDLSEFYALYLTSGIAHRFENGDFTVIVGKSGVELAYEVLDECGITYNRVKPLYTMNRSEEYWTGWALAYYQWETAKSFENIDKRIPIDCIRAMYHPYHEMDILSFVERMNEFYKGQFVETKIKKLRKRINLTQKELAELSEIPVRTIQQYEQRQKDINKAQVNYLLKLSKALHCRIEDLLEDLI